MAKSIMQTEKECYLCRKKFNVNMTVGLEEHHIFGGANRKISEREGLKVWLCLRHHNTPPYGVHFNYENMKALREDGQREFEKSHTRDEFYKLFGKNYLED